MQKRLGGIWELFMPTMQEGDTYKYEIRTQQGHIYEKADPYGFLHEIRPQNGSIVSKLKNFNWNDSSWISNRDSSSQINKPISVYEMPSLHFDLIYFAFLIQKVAPKTLTLILPIHA